MKRLLPLASLALSFVITLSAEAADSLKLLTIGNSFANDATAYLAPAAATAGKEVKIYRANLGGHSLQQHASYLAAARNNSPEGNKYPQLDGAKEPKISLPEALKGDQWDVVTIQQVSSQSFKPESYEPYAGEIITAVKELAPNAKIWVHETWQYRRDHPSFVDKKVESPDAMYQGLHEAYKELAARYDLEIIPVGTAFHKALTNGWDYEPDTNFNFDNPPANETPKEKKGLHIGWKWGKKAATNEPRFYLDGIHANTAGRYLGATVFLFTLFPDVKDHSFVPKGLTPEEAAELRKIARDVVPFKGSAESE